DRRRLRSHARQSPQQPFPGAGSTPIPAIGDLDQIASQVLGRDVMEDATDRSLESGVHALGRVAVHAKSGLGIGARELVRGMSNGQMRAKRTPYPSVRGQFVGYKCRFLIYPPDQSPPEPRRTVRGNHFHPYSTTSFHSHQYAGLPVATARDLSPLRPRTTVPSARLAADIGLVRFDDPGESPSQKRIRSHERPDPVRQVPGASVADPEPQGQPPGTDAMSGSGHEIHGRQPGSQRKMRPVERGPRGDAEPIPAVPAIELTRACGQPTDEIAGAAGTAHPIRPAGGLEPSPTRGFRAELVQQTWQRPIVHDHNLPDTASTPESGATRQ